MAKAKYHFNHHTLSFEKARTTFKAILIKALSFISTSLVLSAVIIFVWFSFFGSPKERMLERELQQYELQFSVVNDRLQNVESVLNDLADRDDNIYRIIFEADPIPDNVRQAGIGGADRYLQLEGYKNSNIIINTLKKLDHITAEMYVQSKSFDDVYKMAKNKALLLASLPAIQPVSNKDLKRLSSYFGYRIDPYYKVRKFHEGVDFSAPTGTEIYATGDGVVIERKRTVGGYGNVIKIDNGFGYKTLFAHIQEFKVNVGERVKRGQVIALVGNTGKSTAPHLHYEVWKNGKAVDPINYFFNDLTPEQYDEMLTLSATPSQTMD